MNFDFLLNYPGRDSTNTRTAICKVRRNEKQYRAGYRYRVNVFDLGTGARIGWKVFKSYELATEYAIDIECNY